MRRRLLNLLALLSLLLCVGVASLWIYLYAASAYTPNPEPVWTRSYHGLHHQLWFSGGSLRYEAWRDAQESARPATSSRVIAVSNVRRLTFAATVPLGAAVAALAVPPVLWSWHRNRTRRRCARGLCALCGYDLRDNFSGVCPECGTRQGAAAIGGLETIVWRHGWRVFDAPDREDQFLDELCRETGEANPQHPLHAKGCRVVGWRGDDFIVHLPTEDRYAFVHLTWSGETDYRWPHCELFESIDELNNFLADSELDA